MKDGDLKTSVYVDLDSILDTRLTLLSSLNSELAKDMLISGKWFNRVIDSFKVYSSAYFNMLYKKRNESILRTANSTYIMNIIHEAIYVRRRLALARGQEGIHKLYVNTYPYSLTDAETNILKLGIKTKLLESVDVIMIFEKTISVEFIKKEFYIGYMYKGMKWINDRVFDGSLLKSSLPEFTLVVPAIIESEDNIHNVTKESFEELMEQCKVYINLNFIDSLYFSVPEVKKE